MLEEVEFFNQIMILPLNLTSGGCTISWASLTYTARQAAWFALQITSTVPSSLCVWRRCNLLSMNVGAKSSAHLPSLPCASCSAMVRTHIGYPDQVAFSHSLQLCTSMHLAAAQCYTMLQRGLQIDAPVNLGLLYFQPCLRFCRLQYRQLADCSLLALSSYT